VISLNLVDFQFDCPFVAGEYPSSRYGHTCCVVMDENDEEKMFIGGIGTDYCTMDIHFLKQRERRPGQTWEPIIEKSEFETRVTKQANDFIFENVKYLNLLQDKSIHERSIGYP
jgi:hypothetical protein